MSIMACYLSIQPKIFLLGLAVFSSSCNSEQGIRVVPSSTYTSGLEAFDLSGPQRTALERKAVAGDVYAAKKLVLYHAMITKDGVEINKWEKVVKQNIKNNDPRKDNEATKGGSSAPL